MNARTILTQFAAHLRALPGSMKQLSVTDPVALDPPDPDVAEPTPWSNVLWWPHVEFAAAKAAWAALAQQAGRVSKDKQFIGANQDTPPVIAQRIDSLLAETSPRTSNSWLWWLLPVGAMAYWGLNSKKTRRKSRKRIRRRRRR